jgi:hypothetical protein
MELSDEDVEGKSGALLTGSPVADSFEPMSSYSPLRRPMFKRARPTEGPIHAFASSSNVMPTQATPTEVPRSEALREINPFNTRPAASLQLGYGSISPLERVMCDNTTCYEVPAPKTANASASTQQNPIAAQLSLLEASENSSAGDPMRTWRAYSKDWVKW